MTDINKEGSDLPKGDNPDGGIDPNVDLSQLSDEQKAELKKKADEELASTLEKIKALRQEKNRVVEKTKESEQEFQKKFRDEQIAKATARFSADFSLSQEESAAILESFAKVDSGALDADLIYGDLKKAFALANVDTLIKAKAEKEELEKNAAEFLAGSIGGVNTKPEEGKSYSPAAYDYVKEARKQGVELSLDQAEAYVSKGNRRIYN